MAFNVDLSDYLILGTVALATLLWFTKGTLWSVPKTQHPQIALSSKPGKTRNIVEKMRDQVCTMMIIKSSLRLT